MSNRYVVWSNVVDEKRDVSLEVIEVRRTDPKVANEDAAIIRDIFRRRAWVQDTEERT